MGARKVLDQLDIHINKKNLSPYITQYQAKNKQEKPTKQNLKVQYRSECKS